MYVEPWLTPEESMDFAAVQVLRDIKDYGWYHTGEQSNELKAQRGSAVAFKSTFPAYNLFLVIPNQLRFSSATGFVLVDQQKNNNNNFDKSDTVIHSL